MKHARRGLTLIEFLVVTGILVLIVAVLLPTILSQREEVRRVQCRDNLRQISLALVTYESVGDTIPPGWVTSNQFGWNLLLIPDLQDIALYPTWNHNVPWSGQPPQLFTVTGLHPRRIPSLRCPVDAGSELVGPSLLKVSVGRSNYPGVSGAIPISNVAVDVAQTRGAFGENSSWNFAKDFADGTSNTLLVGERRSSGGPPSNPGGDTIWAGIRDNQTQQGQALVIGDCAPTNLPNFHGSKPVAITGFSSFHKGGVNFGFADGSARFISDDIDPTTYGRLATIDDGHKVSGF